MHAPDHAGVLPDHLDPMPMPDTKREAEMLVLCLDSRLYPKLVSEEEPAEEAEAVTYA